MRFGRFILFLTVIFVAAFCAGGGGTLWKQSLPALPSFNTFQPVGAGLTSKVYRIVFLKSAIDQKLNQANFVKLAKIPLPMQQAIIAMEDNRFYQHIGIDIEGIFRASLVNLQKGSIIEGGSTITQQLVKNLFLSQEQTMTRKFEEALLALDMECRYSKEEILEMYLNTIYFGAGAYGIRDASQIYFSKSTTDLNLAESALLAGLPNGPSIYSPYVDMTAAKQRQSLVLNAMVRHGYIGPGTALEAKTFPLVLKKNK